MKNNYTLLYTFCRCKYAKICIYYAGKWKFKRCLSPDKTRKNDMIKILFVCHGNICRSTMAESVMTYLVQQHHLAEQFEISSAATSREEIGNPPHYGTVGKLRQVGIPLIPHRAVQMTRADYEYYDYLSGMDSANIRNMIRIAGDDRDNKIYKLLQFAGIDRDVADPWYTGDFEATYKDVMTGCEALLQYILESNK